MEVDRKIVRLKYYTDEEVLLREHSDIFIDYVTKQDTEVEKLHRHFCVNACVLTLLKNVHQFLILPFTENGNLGEIPGTTERVV